MRPAADTEELHSASSVSQEISQRIFIRLVQPDNLILLMEQKAHGWQSRTRRGVWRREASQWNVVVNEIFAFSFQVQAFCPNLVSTDILSQLL